MLDDYKGGKIVVLTMNGLLHLDMVDTLRNLAIRSGWTEEAIETWWLNYSYDPDAEKMQRPNYPQFELFDGLLVSSYIYDEAMIEVNPELLLIDPKDVAS